MQCAYTSAVFKLLRTSGIIHQNK